MHTNINHKVKNKRMDAETLWNLGTVAIADVSPDKSKLLYTAEWTDIEENKSHKEIYIMNVDGSNKQQLTDDAENNPSCIFWRPDSQCIGFVKSKQLWEINPDGSGLKQVSDFEGGITAFRYAPDQSMILYTQEVTIDKTITQPYEDMPKAKVRKVKDLMYCHWDTYVDGKFSHVFYTPYGEKLEAGIDIMEGEAWEAPIRPFNGIGDIIWSPDSKSIIYACRKKEGLEYAHSTNSNLYCYNINTKSTKNLTEGMMGYDLTPVFSNNGKTLAWQSQERDGYEADVVRLAMMDWDSKHISIYDNDDVNVHDLCFDSTDQYIYFTSVWHGRYRIYRFNRNNSSLDEIKGGNCDYHGLYDAGDYLITTKQSHSSPTDIFALSKTDKVEANISKINTPILEQITMGETRDYWVKTTDGKEMLVWEILPPNFDPNKKYPTILYCQGGPQSAVSHFWSLRWNFQNFVANDYIIIAPNRRGLPGFGREWNESISKDHGGQCMQDYLSAIDHFSAKPYVDKTRLGAIGASFGGLSVYWLAGNHEKRFKAFVSHCGIFNFEAMYLDTEEMWFENWEMGGNFWEKDNDAAKKHTFASSPHRFVQNWDTPIQVIHGGKDYRVPESQGRQAFNAARLLGLDAEFLNFPEENHWVLSPQNGIVWQRSVVDWLDKWLK